jgi:4-amino-4-deoxy-L-arabinose transferase-like glycosyltransferase
MMMPTLAPPDRPPRFFRATLAWPLLLLALAALLRLPGLGESLWYDEVLYATRFPADSLAQLARVLVQDDAAPVYRILMHFWAGWCGNDERLLRLPSLLCGLATLWLTLRISSAFGSPRAGSLAAVFLVFSPVHVWYSQEAVGYTLGMALLLSAVWIGLGLRDGTRTRGWFLLYGAAVLGAVFTHYFAAVFLLPLSLLAWPAAPRVRLRLLVLHGLIGGLTVAVLLLKWKLGGFAFGYDFLRPFTLFRWWMLFLDWFLQGNSIWTSSPTRTSPRYLLENPALLACQLTFLFLLFRGLRAAAGDARPGAARELATFLLVGPLVLFLLTLAGRDRMYIERYLLPALPFFALALARGALAVSNRHLRRAAVGAIVLIAVVSHVQFRAKGEAWTVYKQNPDSRAVAAHLLAPGWTAEQALFLLPAGRVDLAYYLERQGGAGQPPVEDYDEQKLNRLFRSGTLRAVYLVVPRYPDRDVEPVRRTLTATPFLDLADRRAFKAVEVLTFVPRPPGAPP